MERIEKGKVLKAEDLLPMKAGHTISKAIDDHLFVLAGRRYRYQSGDLFRR